MTKFTALGLAEPTLRGVTAEGYTTPTPIQSKLIPAMLAGRDVLGTAQTGTGKTAAFALPIVDALGAGAGRPEPRTCRALVLAPTRELAAQIEESIRALAVGTRLTTALVVGGVKPGPQVRALARGVDVLVATPGRLEDHLREGALTLSKVRVVVLDEADQMLDLGFIPAIRRLVAKLPRERQTALLSATMPPAIRTLAYEILRDPAEISVAPVSTPVEAVVQSVRHLDRTDKRDALAAILTARDVERAIVFTRTKRGADKVSRQLAEAGCDAVAIHGNKSQSQRQRALDAFRTGTARILVATDIAARGIDVDGVSHVVNYELPNVPEAYVHRIGRTARAGRSGVAVSLCEPDERPLLADIERLIGRRIAVEGAPASPAAASASPSEPTTERAAPPRRRRPRSSRSARPDTPSRPRPARSTPSHGAGPERSARDNTL
ncbi:DEAD/DEAH box helicase [Acuticoccus sp.]|uniref:DEAD/DEAH box helicase n=1 Tax=Acuticoccus sp. TaxID=1904378 RepID=UPI003B51B59B